MESYKKEITLENIADTITADRGKKYQQRNWKP